VQAVGLARSTYRRLPLAQTPADPDAALRVWVRAYATKHPCHGCFGVPGRPWAMTSVGEVNKKKKVDRVWRAEGLQVRVHSPRKRGRVVVDPAD
jgi:hypothetical protein